MFRISNTNISLKMMTWHVIDYPGIAHVEYKMYFGYRRSRRSTDAGLRILNMLET